VVEGSNAVEPDDPTKSGFNFDGWYTDPGLTSRYNFGTPVNADLTLYAGWTRNPVYLVEFESNGGTEIAHQDIEENETAVRPDPPVKSGYTFAGWYLDEACTVPYDFSTPVTHDIDLYAKWDPVPVDPDEPAASNPPTGDAGRPVLWFALTVTSMFGIVIVRRRSVGQVL